MNHSVAVIVLQYNNFFHTKNFLKSFLKVSYENYELIFVDNNSSDHSLNNLKEYLTNRKIVFSSIKYKKNRYNYMTKNKNGVNLIESDKNGGYSYGINVGLNFALRKKYDYYLVINNDTVVTKKFIEPLISLSQKNKKNALISSKILYYEKKDRIWFVGGSMPRYSLNIKHYDFGLNDKNSKYPQSNFISGCTNFISHEALIDIGLHDENIFFYGDDIDFSLRFRKKGYQLLVAHDSIVYHNKKYPDQINLFQQENLTRSKKKLINKHFEGIFWLSAHLDNIFYSFFKHLYYRNLSLILAHFKGLLKK